MMGLSRREQAAFTGLTDLLRRDIARNHLVRRAELGSDSAGPEHRMQLLCLRRPHPHPRSCVLEKFVHRTLSD